MRANAIRMRNSSALLLGKLTQAEERELTQFGCGSVGAAQCSVRELPQEANAIRMWKRRGLPGEKREPSPNL